MSAVPVGLLSRESAHTTPASKCHFWNQSDVHESPSEDKDSLPVWPTQPLQVALATLSPALPKTLSAKAAQALAVMQSRAERLQLRTQDCTVQDCWVVQHEEQQSAQASKLPEQQEQNEQPDRVQGLGI